MKHFPKLREERNSSPGQGKAPGRKIMRTEKAKQSKARQNENFEAQTVELRNPAGRCLRDSLRKVQKPPSGCAGASGPEGGKELPQSQKAGSHKTCK